MDLMDAVQLRGFSEIISSSVETSKLSLGVDTNDSRYGEPLRFYLLLTHFPELIEDTVDPSARFYARYFWFRTFSNRFQAAQGFDAGLEQQCFQLIEQADVPIDWEVVEQLDKRATATDA